jgi:hypothetical protein
MTKSILPKATTLTAALVTAALLVGLILVPASPYSYGQSNRGVSNQGPNENHVHNENSYGKVVLCHIPPGNPESRQTLTVDATAVPDHLGHGDYLGPCI